MAGSRAPATLDGERRAARPLSLRKLIGASALTNLGDGIIQLALPLVALSQTREPIALAGVTAAMKAPWLMFVLVSGVIADRVDKRALLNATDSIRAVVCTSLALAVALDVQVLAATYLAALLLGTCETLRDTSAQALTPSVVPEENLTRANSRLYGTELVANQFVGPPLAGLLFTIGLAVGPAAAAICFAAAAFIVSSPRKLHQVRWKSVRRVITVRRSELLVGVRAVLGDRSLRVLAVVTGLFNGAQAATYAVLPLHAISPGPMKLTAPGYSLLLLAAAAGSLAGSFLAPHLERRWGRGITLLVGTGFAALEPLGIYLTTNPVAVAVFFVVGAVFAVSWNVVVVTIRQQAVRSDVLGRTTAAYRLIAWGPIPIFAVAAGVAAEMIGIRTIFLLSTVIVLCLIVPQSLLVDSLNTTHAETR